MTSGANNVNDFPENQLITFHGLANDDNITEPFWRHKFQQQKLLIELYVFDNRVRLYVGC